MKEFLKGFFSIKEERTSTVIILCVLSTAVALYKYLKGYDLSSNMTTLLITYIATIGGTNVIPSISSMFNKNGGKEV